MSRHPSELHRSVSARSKNHAIRPAKAIPRQSLRSYDEPTLAPSRLYDAASNFGQSFARVTKLVKVNVTLVKHR